VAVKVQSLSLLLEMNSLEEEQSLPVELISNLERPIPILDPSSPTGDTVIIEIMTEIEHAPDDWIFL
jgi:hypothetical protein